MLNMPLIPASIAFGLIMTRMVRTAIDGKENFRLRLTQIEHIAQLRCNCWIRRYLVQSNIRHGRVPPREAENSDVDVTVSAEETLPTYRNLEYENETSIRQNSQCLHADSLLQQMCPSVGDAEIDLKTLHDDS